MDADTKSDLQDHILECSQNYGELKAEVALQNAKIDVLGDKDTEMYKFAKWPVLYVLLGTVNHSSYARRSVPHSRIRSEMRSLIRSPMVFSDVTGCRRSWCQHLDRPDGSFDDHCVVTSVSPY